VSPAPGSAARNVWLILIALTLVSTLLAEKSHQAHIAIVFIFAISAAKGDLVLIHYMEARSAEPHWIIMYRIWLIVVASVLAIGHLV
jgi:heme/copper-type cytochrome/quinol oxidase subunit 4